MSLSAKLPAFDLFSKTDSSYRIQTRTGATRMCCWNVVLTEAVSIVAMSLMALLFLFELSTYLSVEVTPVLSVDTSREGKIKINMDITFPALPCICMLKQTYVYSPPKTLV